MKGKKPTGSNKTKVNVLTLKKKIIIIIKHPMVVIGATCRALSQINSTTYQKTGGNPFLSFPFLSFHFDHAGPLIFIKEVMAHFQSKQSGESMDGGTEKGSRGGKDVRTCETNPAR